MIDEYMWDMKPECCPDCMGIDITQFELSDYYRYYQFLINAMDVRCYSYNCEADARFYSKYFYSFVKKMTKLWRDKGFISHRETLDDVCCDQIYVTIRYPVTIPHEMHNHMDYDPVKEAHEILEKIYEVMPDHYRDCYDETKPYSAGISMIEMGGHMWSKVQSDSPCPVCGKSLLYSEGNHCYTIKCPVCGWEDSDTTW
jgi:rubredoxin